MNEIVLYESNKLEYTREIPIVILRKKLSKKNDDSRFYVSCTFQNLSTEIITEITAEIYTKIGNNIFLLDKFSATNLSIKPNEKFENINQPFLNPINNFYIVINSVVTQSCRYENIDNLKFEVLDYNLEVADVNDIHTKILDNPKLKNRKLYKYNTNNFGYNCVCGQLNHYRNNCCINCGTTLENLKKKKRVFNYKPNWYVIVVLTAIFTYLNVTNMDNYLYGKIAYHMGNIESAVKNFEKVENDKANNFLDRIYPEFVSKLIDEGRFDEVADYCLRLYDYDDEKTRVYIDLYYNNNLARVQYYYDNEQYEELVEFVEGKDLTFDDQINNLYIKSKEKLS